MTSALSESEFSESEIFLNWEEAFGAKTQLVGGKAWNLARLTRFGFKVPPGGVLTTDVYRQFIAFNQLEEIVKLISQTVHTENLEDMAGQLARLREKIQAGAFPPAVLTELNNRLADSGLLAKPLAVRSSASAEDSAQASFAGVHDSYLNVHGLDKVIEAVKGCFASVWSLPAVAYRRKMGIPDQAVLPAVVIMEMVPAVSAGVAFTCDPQSGRPDRIVINANFGLGESVVSGAVEPDTYYLDYSSFRFRPRIVAKKIGSKQGKTTLNANGGTQLVTATEAPDLRQTLTDDQIVKLGLILIRIYEALGDCEQHQDVEWAFDGQDFILLQARPVTSVPNYTFDALKYKPMVWSNGNYRDALPMVLSPLHRRVMKEGIDLIQSTSLLESGYAMPEGLEFSRLFQGRLYCDISALQWAYYDSSGLMPQDFIPFWGGHQPVLEIEDREPLKEEEVLKRQQRGMQGQQLIMEAAANAPEIFAEVIASIQNLMGEGIDKESDADLIKKFDDLGNIVEAYCKKYGFLVGYHSSMLFGLIFSLMPYLGPRTSMVANSLLVGGETASTSAEHGYQLMEMAELARQEKAAVAYLTSREFDPMGWEEQLPEDSLFKQSFRRYMRDFGHRAVYELDIVNPRWREDPTFLLETIRSSLDTADLNQRKVRQKVIFNEAWQEILDKVPSENQENVRQGIKQVQKGAALREMTKSVLVMIMEPYRHLAKEIGARLSQRGLLAAPADVFYASWTDLLSILSGEWDGARLNDLVTDRKIVQKQNELLSPPDVILGDKPVFSQSTVIMQPAGDYFQGAAAAAGKASGSARLIKHPGEGTRLQPGEVLVAPSTDPGWTPLFLRACAVVMETGGFLSHGAVVAREYGIPAVVNVPGIMGAVKDGQKLTVDGDEGKVLIL